MPRTSVMDAYIRVSTVGGREGEAFRSPDHQRARIEEWALRNDVEIGRVEQDLDVSGGLPASERKLEKLLKRAEAGASDGIVVYSLSRFGRNNADINLNADRLTGAGKRLVSVADPPIDTAAGNSEVVIGVFGALAQQERRVRKESFRAAVEAAVAEGKHCTPWVPYGYCRKDQVDPQQDSRGRLVKDARLVKDPEAAPHVKRAFEMRARGISIRKICDDLEERADRSWAPTTVSSLLQNEVYIGTAKGLEFRKAGAHEPLVSPGLFAAAQPATRKDEYDPRGGKHSRKALLVSPGGRHNLIQCEHCGHGLRVIASKGKGGPRPSYSCRGRYSDGRCLARPAARVDWVDGVVLDALQHADVEEVASGLRSAELRIVSARQAVAEAEKVLAHWSGNPQLVASMGEESHLRAVAEAASQLETARAELWRAEADHPDASDVRDGPVVSVGGKKYLYELWPDSIAERRKLLSKYIAKVTLAKADPRRRRWQPIAERVTIHWHGGGVTTGVEVAEQMHGEHPAA